MVFNLKTTARMSPMHISIAEHSRFSPLDFLQEAAIIYLFANLSDRPRAYRHHHRHGQVNHRRLSTFLSPQQDDVRRRGLDPLPRVFLLVLPNLVRVVPVGPLDVEHCHNKHERNCGLGMDTLVSVCSSNPNGIKVWAWMLSLAYALRTRTEL